MADHLWTVEDRRHQLEAIIEHAQRIKRGWSTDAYDAIITRAQEFLDLGFTHAELKAFSREVGSPPGWRHPRSDGRVELLMADPELVRRIDRIYALLEDLRAIGTK